MKKYFIAVLVLCLVCSCSFLSVMASQSEVEPAHTDLIGKTFAELENIYGTYRIEYDRAIWDDYELEVEFLFNETAYNLEGQSPNAKLKDELICYAVISDNLVENLEIGMLYDELHSKLGDPIAESSYHGMMTWKFNTKRDDVCLLAQFYPDEHPARGLYALAVVKTDKVNELVGLALFPDENGEQLLNMDDHRPYLYVKDGKFRPDDFLTRGEAAHMFYGLLKEQDSGQEIFTDLAGTDCFTEANALGELGIFAGYEDGGFRPDNPITRAEFVTILHKFFEFETFSEDIHNFADVTDNHWAFESIQFAVSKGWVSGFPGETFAPDKNITRAESAVIMNRVLLRTPDKETIDSAKDVYVYLDVPAGHWAFYEIMEATFTHE